MSESILESEASSGAKNPVPWLTPMVVMWSTVIIVIALIVLGTWLNKRAFEEDTRDVVTKFSAVLDDFAFTPEQRETLVEELNDTLHVSTVRDVRRDTAERLSRNMFRTIAAVSLQATIGGIDDAVNRTEGHNLVPLNIRDVWPKARHECHRLLYAVDRGEVDAVAAVQLVASFFAKWKEWTVESMKDLETNCKKLSDEAGTPDVPGAFDVYESFHRGIVEARPTKK